MQSLSRVATLYLWIVALVASMLQQGMADDFFVSPDEIGFDAVDAPLPAESESAGADDDADEEANLAEEIRLLRRRLDQLERAEQKRLEKERKKQEEEQKKAAEPKKVGGKSDEKPKDNVWIDVSEEKWTVKLGGHVQMDSINWAYADPAISGTAAGAGARDYFEFRRLRLTADGTGYGVYDFRLQMTLEPDAVGNTQVIPPGGAQIIPTTPSVKDAYFTINEIPWIGRFRIGNFFVPFGLEQVTNDTFNVFLERSIPTQGIFTGDRQVGVATYNTNDAQNVTWSFGAFYDSISDTQKSRIDNNQGTRLSGRLTFLPYYDDASEGRYLVHTGAGVFYTNRFNHLVQFRTRPEIRQGPFLVDTGVLDAQSYTTGNLEAAVVWGPVTVQSEAYITSLVQSNNQFDTFHGAYTHISYFLTGENRIYEKFGQHGAQFGRNKPINTVWATPNGASWGAWEAKARWSYLSFADINRGRIDDVTVGFNWYWSDRTRVMFDYIHTVTTGNAVFGSTQSDILGTRFDFNW